MTTTAMALSHVRLAIDMIGAATREAFTRRLVARALQVLDDVAHLEVEQLARDAERKRLERAEAAAATPPAPPRSVRGRPRTSADAASLSLSLDFNQQRESSPAPLERELAEAVVDAVAATPATPPPPLVGADDALSAERRAVAERAGVRDPERCWRVFCAHFAGRVLLDLDARWGAWCARERDRAPPKSAPRLRAVPRAAPEPEADEPRALAPPGLLGSLLERLGGPSLAKGRAIAVEAASAAKV